MAKAIFLDRDGTINEEVNYLKKIEDIKIFPNTVKALQIFKNLGFLNIVITNQSGIARGFITEEDLEQIHEEFKRQINFNGNNILIDDFFFSPFHQDGIIEKYKINSEDRKPGTGMIAKAIAKYNIDLKESYLIGDSFTDMKCAENAGLKKILVRTGYGRRDFEKCKDENSEPDYFADDLFDAAGFIQKNIYKN